MKLSWHLEKNKKNTSLLKAFFSLCGKDYEVVACRDIELYVAYLSRGDDEALHPIYGLVGVDVHELIRYVETWLDVVHIEIYLDEMDRRKLKENDQL